MMHVGVFSLCILSCDLEESGSFNSLRGFVSKDLRLVK